MATTVGTIQVVASINTRGYDAGKKHIERGNKELEGNAEKTSKGFSAAWIGAIAGVAASLANKFLGAVTSSIDGAVKRVDTLNNSARTFENMGIGAEDSAKAMDALEKSIKGLPTPLDSAVRGMTALTATYDDIDKGQKVFSALNNAILGFGGTSAMVDNAITQLSQLPMDGPLDAQTWNSLRNSGITPVLTAMAKDSGMSVAEMKKAFGDGELTVQDFINRLIKLDKEGGGGLTSLEKIAKDSTKGIGTGFANMQTAITRGLAEVMEAIGSENISKTITIIGKAFETALKTVATVITELPGAIQKVIDTLTEMGNFVKNNAVAFGAFAVAAGALAAPFAIAVANAALFNLQLKILAARAKVTSILKGIAGGIKAVNAALRANPIGLVIAAIALLVGSFMLLWKNNEGFRNFFINAWNEIKSTFYDVMGGIISAFNTISQKVSDFVNVGLNALTVAFKAVSGWIRDNAKLLTNIGIILSTFLTPTLLKVGIEFTKMGAKAVVSAGKAAKAWVTSTGKIAIQMTKTAVTSSVQAIKAGAAWVVEAGKASFVWVTKTLPELIAGFVRASGSAVKNAFIAGGSWVKQAALTAGAWVKTFGAYMIGVAKAAARTVAAGAKMAASWLLAMGPIGLIIALVATATGLIIANLDKVKRFVSGVWSSIRNGASSAWNSVTSIFRNVGSWFKTNVVNRIVNAFSGIGGRISRFFSGIWSGVGNSLKSAVNMALRLPLRIPSLNIKGIGQIGGQTLIPALAKGGIVTSPTLAMIGEGRESEAVIPLSKLDKMLENNTSDRSQDNQPVVVVSLRHSKGAMRQAALDTIELVNEVYRAKGLPQIGVQE